MAPLVSRKQHAFRNLALDISIDDIIYETGSQPGFKTLDQKRILLLKHRFIQEGCQTQTYPISALNGPQGYTCLDGKHRIEAGKLLDPPIRSWAVLVYEVDKEDRELLLLLRDGDSGLIPYCDGDIYRNVMASSNAVERRTWLAKLSPSKQKDVKRLTDNAESYRATGVFKAALDRLLEFPGLWADLRISCFHRLLAMHCPEELSHYLTEVYHCWHTICGGSSEMVTVSTVRHLEGKYPCSSRADRQAISDASSHRMIFETAPDDERNLMVGRCLQLPGRIISLGYFFEDTKFLEPAAKILRSLFETTTRKSLRTQMSQSITNTATDAWNAYLSVWCRTLQSFPLIETDYTLRKDPKRPKPARKKRSAMMSFLLAQFIMDRGFDSVKLRRLRDMDYLTPHILTLIDETCPDASDDSKRKFISPIREALNQLHSLPSERSNNTLPSWQSNHPLRDEERCGMPFEAAFLQDSEFFTPETVYSYRDPGTNSLFPSSLALRADQISCFLPKKEDLIRQQVAATPLIVDQPLPPMDQLTTVHPQSQAQSRSGVELPQQQTQEHQSGQSVLQPSQGEEIRSEQMQIQLHQPVQHQIQPQYTYKVLPLDANAKYSTSFKVGSSTSRSTLRPNLPEVPQIPRVLWRKGSQSWKEEFPSVSRKQMVDLYRLVIGQFLAVHNNFRVFDEVTLLLSGSGYEIVNVESLPEITKEHNSLWTLSKRGGSNGPWQFSAVERARLISPLVLTLEACSFERLDTVEALNLVLESYPN